MTAGRDREVVFLDRGTLPSWSELPVLEFPHRLVLHDRSAPSEVRARIAGADIVIVNKTVLDRGVLATAPRLRHVAVAATGYDNIDLGACADRGISVSNVRGYAVDSVPEHTFALLFALRRSIVAYHASVGAGAWQAAGQFCYFDHPIRDLKGSTLGIIGFGTIGRAVATIGRALGMTVQVAARKGEATAGPGRVPFVELLRTSDVVTLHAPLSPETRHLLSDPEFAVMDRRPILLNASRGGLVDEAALCRALAQGRIAGAGFDVASTEPPPADHPLMSLIGLPNVLLTPHVAWASREAVDALVSDLFANINAFAQGAPRNLLTS